MTISYQLSVANATFAGFPKLLARWKGSVYKLMCRELLVFSFLYATVSVVYRWGLSEEHRRVFERWCIHIDETINHVPLTFVLGFYVSFVVSRWWEQLVSYPWPDRMLYLLTHSFPGSDERSRMYRRTLARYLNVSTILLARSLSVVTKKRFPTLEHMVDAGLLTKDELKMYNDIQLQYGKFWVPLVWFTQLIGEAKEEGLLHDPTGLGTKEIFEELLGFRTSLGKMFMYDWVSIPISYTQVVTLATYSYFLGCLFSRQPLDPTQSYKGHAFDAYVPIFTVLQFVFYVGWLKVAEALINPWGEDDDDFEVNWFIDRHMQVSYAIVDDMHGKTPQLVKDMYWGTTEVQIPYTLSAVESKRDEVCADLGSTVDYEVPLNKQRLSVTNQPSSRRTSLTVGPNPPYGYQNLPNGSGTGSTANMLARQAQWDSMHSFGTPGHSRRKSGVFLVMPDKNEMATIKEAISPTPSTMHDNAYSGPLSPSSFNGQPVKHTDSSGSFGPPTHTKPTQQGIQVFIDDSSPESRRSSRLFQRERPRSLVGTLGNVAEQSPSPTSPTRDEDSSTPLIRPKHF